MVLEYNGFRVVASYIHFQSTLYETFFIFLTNLYQTFISKYIILCKWLLKRDLGDHSQCPQRNF